MNSSVFLLWVHVSSFCSHFGGRWLIYFLFVFYFHSRALPPCLQFLSFLYILVIRATFTTTFIEEVIDLNNRNKQLANTEDLLNLNTVENLDNRDAGADIIPKPIIAFEDNATRRQEVSDYLSWECSGNQWGDHGDRWFHQSSEWNGGGDAHRGFLVLCHLKSSCCDIISRIHSQLARLHPDGRFVATAGEGHGIQYWPGKVDAGGSWCGGGGWGQWVWGGTHMEDGSGGFPVHYRIRLIHFLI